MSLNSQAKQKCAPRIFTRQGAAGTGNCYPVENIGKTDIRAPRALNRARTRTKHNEINELRVAYARGRARIYYPTDNIFKPCPTPQGGTGTSLWLVPARPRDGSVS